jgi:RNA polymerase sigma-70 factor (ECF subfamily)
MGAEGKNKTERPRPSAVCTIEDEMTTAEAIVSQAFPTADAAQEVEALVREHARLVFRIAYAVLRNHHDAEDAVQETFLRVLRHRSKLAGVAERKAWLGRIAWRVALDRIRKRAGQSTTPLDEAADAVLALRRSGASAEQIAGDRQLLSLLQRLIAGLPAELREALTLSTVQELSSVEVAAVLGIPASVVRNRVFRARRLLREKLGALLEGHHAR